MKKFITALASILLAGSMAFSFAACKGNSNDTDNNGDNTTNSGGNNDSNNSGNNNGGNNGNNNGGNNDTEDNVSLSDAIKATMAHDNYKLTVSVVASVTFFYNGSPLAADTVVTTTDGDMTGLDFIKSATQNDNLEKFENPVNVELGKIVYGYDFVNGRVKTDNIEDGETETEYYEVDGTSIHYYYLDYNKKVRRSSYIGYANEAQAKQVFNKILSTDSEIPTFAEVMTSTVKGLGEHSDREGNLADLVDLFEYDKTSKTFTTTVDASSIGGTTFAESEVAITVDGDTATSLVVTVSDEDFLEDLLDGVPDGITAESKLIHTAEYGDFDNISFTIPAEYKNVEQDNIHETTVLSSEDTWKELFTAYPATGFVIDYSNYTNDYRNSPTFYFDPESNTAMIYKYERAASVDTTTRKYYKVEGDKLVTYTWTKGDDNRESFVKTSEDNITGDPTKALLSALDCEFVTDFYAGFDEGALYDLFPKFYFNSFANLKANLKLNGNDVKVYASFSYDDGNNKHHLSYFQVAYNSGDYFNVRFNAKNELENWGRRLPTD